MFFFAKSPIEVTFFIGSSTNVGNNLSYTWIAFAKRRSEAEIQYLFNSLLNDQAKTNYRTTLNFGVT